MKIVELKGGLGNQMFQYAVARASESDEYKDVYLDLSFLNTYSVSTDSFTARGYELGVFNNLRAKELSKHYIKLMNSRGFFVKLYRKLIGFKPLKVAQKGNGFVDIPSAKNLYLDGYFQSEKYFQAIEQSIRHDFQFPELDGATKKIQTQIIGENAVSLHVRRGDYVSIEESNKFHGILQMNHYIDAMEKLSKMDTNLTYYVFSDDLPYVEQELGHLANVTFISGNSGKNSWKDMQLMAACKHHIIANSSFSWWGAWLSEREGITIAPKQWFADNNSFNTDDFIPSRWILL